MILKRGTQRRLRRAFEEWTLPAMAGLILAGLVLLVAIPVRSADNDNINVKVPVDTTVANACTPGESVHLTGDVHVVLNKKGSGDRVSYSGHVNTQGLKGTGAPSGRRYTASGTGKISTDAQALPADFFVTGRFRLISKGPAENLHGQATVKVSVKANGSYTTSIQALSLECK